MIDLHAHSRASDGTDAPAEVVRAAGAQGVDVVALTDHDSTRGWKEAVDALPPGVTLVRGAELSCSTGGVSLHLLAYLFDPGAAALLAEMEHARDDRVPRARAMVERLAAAGYDLTWEAVLATAGDATVGRPHIADTMVSRGLVRDRDEAFAGPLHNRSPFYVRHYAIDPVVAVRLVAEAGGTSVFAHPGASRRGRTVGDDVIAELAAAGLDGLEVDHPDHDEATRGRLRGLAGELGLLVTGASDYHGSGKPQRLGAETTDPEVYAALVARSRALDPVAA